MNFTEYMNQEKSVNRWFVFRIAVLGAMAGTLLTTMYFLMVVTAA